MKQMSMSLGMAALTGMAMLKRFFASQRPWVGSYLVADKTVAVFTDEEERADHKDTIVPFLLASTLQQRGAHHTKAGNFEAHVEVDGRLVTGQNPASATGVAEALVRVLHAVSP